MDHAVRAYLDAYPPHHETTERWPIQDEMKVRLSLAETLPPLHVSSSILAIVFNTPGQFLFLNPKTPGGSISHLLIGGRPEGNETPHQTAVREVGEETGWRIKPIGMIGFRHFFHLEPRWEKTDRPYPDFIQPIFAASAIEFDRNLVLPNDHIPAEFIDFEKVREMTDPQQRPLLDAAVRVRRDQPI